MAHDSSAPIVLDDLAVPRFTPTVEEIRALMATMAADCPLDADTLHKKARSETGLDDFGADDYRERLDVYLADVNALDGLDAPGIVNLHMNVLQCLKNRLLLADLLRRHPEIRDIELLPPVIIAGLPRTGTTHLHQLVAASGVFRTLPYWESVEPFPLPAEVGVEPDPRRARMDLAVDFLNSAMPHFRLMHEMTTDHVHEEIQLLANDFSTMLMETLAYVPRWRDYYLAHDQTPHYEHLRLQLQALQFLRGGRRWALKSPQHLEQLPVVDRVFPGATVVITHRDPVPVVVSMVTMIVYTARMHRSKVPVAELATAWADRLGLMLDAVVRDRHAIPAERSVDVRFDDFMADEPGTVAQVMALAGEDYPTAAQDSVADYLADHRRDRHGRLATSAEQLGLDAEALRSRYSAYAARFL